MKHSFFNRKGPLALLLFTLILSRTSDPCYICFIQQNVGELILQIDLVGWHFKLYIAWTGGHRQLFYNTFIIIIIINWLAG